MTTSELEIQFLLDLPLDKTRISWNEVLDYAAKIGWDMTIEKIAKNIAKATGRHKSQLLQYEDVSRPAESFINIDPITRGYIERLRQMKIGAQQQQEALKKPDEKNE